MSIDEAIKRVENAAKSSAKKKTKPTPDTDKPPFEIVYVDKYNKGYEIRNSKSGAFVDFFKSKNTAEEILYDLPGMSKYKSTPDTETERERAKAIAIAMAMKYKYK